MPIALSCPRETGSLQGDRVLASGLWTAVSGAAAQAHAVDTVANNLANSDTMAFKKDQPAFKEYLSTLERDKESVDVPRGPIKDKDLYPLEGRDQSFVVVNGTHTDFRQGNLRVTNSPMDLALDGKGFLEVSTPSGIRYTRHGSLKMATDGRLVTAEGYPVLASQPGGLSQIQGQVANVQASSQGGLSTRGGVGAEQGLSQPDPSVAARFINLRDRGTISVGESGEIYAGDQLVAKLSVAEFQTQNGLRKVGNHLFENRDPANRSADAKNTIIRQGVLETSNVNPIEEMTNLIKANRLFEQDLKAMKTYGDLMGREANDVGKL